MAESKNTEFERPGGYATPKGATLVQAEAARTMREADIRLLGDTVPVHAAPKAGVEPAYSADDPDTRLYVGDCRHLSYKANYRPHERLYDGDWRRHD